MIRRHKGRYVGKKYIFYTLNTYIYVQWNHVSWKKTHTLEKFKRKKVVKKGKESITREVNHSGWDLTRKLDVRERERERGRE